MITLFKKLLSDVLRYKLCDLKNIKVVIILKNFLLQEIKALFDGKGLLSDQELLKFKENVINDVIRKYENVAKQGILSHIKDYIYEKIANVSDQLLIYRLSVSFINQTNF